MNSDQYLLWICRIFAVIMQIGMVVLDSFIFMVAWNYSMPVMFHLSTINIITGFCFPFLIRLTAYHFTKGGKSFLPAPIQQRSIQSEE